MADLAILSLQETAELLDKAAKLPLAKLQQEMSSHTAKCIIFSPRPASAPPGHWKKLVMAAQAAFDNEGAERMRRALQGEVMLLRDGAATPCESAPSFSETPHVTAATETTEVPTMLSVPTPVVDSSVMIAEPAKVTTSDSSMADKSGEVTSSTANGANHMTTPDTAESLLQGLKSHLRADQLKPKLSKRTVQLWVDMSATAPTNTPPHAGAQSDLSVGSHRSAPAAWTPGSMPARSVALPMPGHNVTARWHLGGHMTSSHAGPIASPASTSTATTAAWPAHLILGTEARLSPATFRTAQAQAPVPQFQRGSFQGPHIVSGVNNGQVPGAAMSSAPSQRRRICRRYFTGDRVYVVLEKMDSILECEVVTVPEDNNRSWYTVRLSGSAHTRYISLKIDRAAQSEAQRITMMAWAENNARRTGVLTAPSPSAVADPVERPAKRVHHQPIAPSATPERIVPPLPPTSPEVGGLASLLTHKRAHPVTLTKAALYGLPSSVFAPTEPVAAQSEVGSANQSHTCTSLARPRAQHPAKQSERRPSKETSIKSHPVDGGTATSGRFVWHETLFQKHLAPRLFLQLLQTIAQYTTLYLEIFRRPDSALFFRELASQMLADLTQEQEEEEALPQQQGSARWRATQNAALAAARALRKEPTQPPTEATNSSRQQEAQPVVSAQPQQQQPGPASMRHTDRNAPKTEHQRRLQRAAKRAANRAANRAALSASSASASSQPPHADAKRFDMTILQAACRRQPRLSAAVSGRGLRGIQARSKTYIAGIGIETVTRQQDKTLEGMGSAAINQAVSHAKLDPKQVRALFVGNMMSGMLSHQQHLGPLLANAAGLERAEAATAEACCGAGGAALRWGYMAIESGEVDVAVVAGVELMTHCDRDMVTKALATASYWPAEGAEGETFVSLNGAVMREYMRRYNRRHEEFAPFAMVAHSNASLSSHAVFRHKSLDRETYEQAQVITDPIQLFDASPTCDGAAAVVLVSDRALDALDASVRQQLVEVRSSAAAIDQLAIAKRPDLLALRAVQQSAEDSFRKAGVTVSDVDIFEIHDAYTIMAACSLENIGVVPPGTVLDLAADGGLNLTGSTPIATFGGLKARGHPVGATGVYQAAEMFLQLTDAAGPNQVSEPEVAFIQNVGGTGSSVFAHVLTRA
ncbi:uncharacterized protein MONBRDRAFT_36228 [Monosiga brevicollis MX1]|uniref:Thiolase N-terminal domain-containing protein n=1 Tax=Monosiga brevicollis TaxID=81824 RepID=A9UTV7_MONBE|nr:uncharacterized protein MONBRDRAFT_36228 [Monosiga brevicollis MX1]EDQ91560.1 predicted protein [Monosiga brevicollis MX1]|eukprot:XP_001743982.1 hypothetical protein [Monosiga brevicollis MX1]